MSSKWTRTVLVAGSMLIAGYTGVRAGRIVADTATISVQQLPGTVVEGTSGHQITFRATADAGTDEFGAEFNFSCGTVTGGASCTSVSPSSWILEPYQYKDIVVTFSAGGTLPTQSITLESQAAGSNSTSGTANVSISRGVTVTAASIPSSVLQYSDGDTAEFEVKNHYSTSKTLSFVCTWGGGECTNPSNTSFSANQTDTIKVPLSTGALLSSHDVTLTATTGVASHADTGSISVNEFANVTVNAQRTPLFAQPSVVHRDTFDVRFPGQSSDDFTMSVSCPGGTGKVSGCSVIGSMPKSVGDGGTEIIVQYWAGSNGDTSTITLTATNDDDPSITSTGEMEVVSTSSILLSVDDANMGLEYNPSDCPQISAGAGSIVCDTYRTVYPITGVSRMNRSRQLALIHDNRMMGPVGMVGANIVLPTGTAEPDSIQARLIVNGLSQPTRMYPASAYAPGEQTRLAVRYSNWGQQFEKLLSYDFEITPYVGTTAQTPIVESGRILSLNHKARYSRAWWIGGLENLATHMTDTLLWTGADASGRVYVKSGSVYIGQSRTTPDTIVVSGSNFIRRVLGGGEVHFNSVGDNTKTVDRNGNETLFTFTSVASWSRLATVSLPTPTGTDTVYTFHYESTYGGMDSLRVRSASGGWDTYKMYTNWGGNDGNEGLLLDSIVAPDGAKTAFRNSHGRLYEIYGPAGDTTSISYPDYLVGTVTVKTDGEPNLVYDYRASARIGYTQSGWNAPRPVGGVSARFDGALSGSADTVAFHVTGFGAVRGIRDADGNETWIDREDEDFPGLPTRVRYPNGREVTTEYTSLGLIDEVTDHSTGGVTQYYWNTTHLQPDSVVTPEGVTSSFTYDSDGNRLTQKVENGGTTTFLYDSDGLVIRVTDPLNNADTLVYDSLGNLASVENPLGHETTYTRDYLGRITETESPIDGTDTKTTAVTYDVMGRVLVNETTNSIDGLWTRVHTEYDTYGRPELRRAYGGDSTVTPQDSTSAGYETWAYDALGRVIVQQSASKLDSMEYDLAGRVTQIRTRRDIGTVDEITMQYDTLGRLTRRIIPSVTYGTIAGELDSLPYYYPDYVIPADTIEYTYDEMGNALTINNRFVEITRTYTLDGLIATDRQAIAEWRDTTDFSTHVYDLSYSYDQDRRRVGLGHPTWLSSGTDQTTYAFDSQGRIETITGPLGDSYGYTYDSANRITRRTFPGGGTSGGSYWGYDAGDRLTSHYVRIANDTVIEATLGHLDNGLIETVDDSWNTDMFYNGMGAVTKNFTQAWEGPQTTENFVMDAFGAQLRSSSIGGEVDDDSVAYENTFDAHGRIIETEEVWASKDYPSAVGWEAGETDFWYDSVGNRTRSRKDQPVWWIHEGAQAIAIRTNTHREETRAFFGADGMMRAYQVNRDSMVHDTIGPVFGDPIVAGKWGVWEEYWYDGLGRRVVKMSRQDDPHCDMTARCHSTIERYVWDGNQLLWEVKQDDQGDTKDPDDGPYSGNIGYIHGGDIDAPLAMMRNGDVVVLHQNWRGLFAFSTDEDGDYTTRTPNGGPLLPSVAWPAGNYVTFTNNRSKDTQHWYGSLAMDQHDATGLMYRRNRYYDGVTGQFTQTDPIGIAGGLNTYGYASGDPMNFSDPFGLCDEPRGKGVGICIESWIIPRRVAGLPVGDGRGSRSDGGGYKTSIRFSIDPATGEISGLEKSIGTTMGIPGVGRLKVETTATDGGYNVLVSGWARSLVNFGGNIDFMFDIRVDADGNASVDFSGVGQFPSFEAWAYPEGGGDPYRIFYSEEEGGPFLGLFGKYHKVELGGGN